MIDKPLQDIAVEDLLRLQTNKVPESRSLEYKQSLPGATDSDRKEFLADVSSFANAIGGDLLYGVTEGRENGRPTGVPEGIAGISGVNEDAENRRLENMLRDGIAPRLPGVQLRWVPGAAQGPVLIVRIPRSWAGPHMVTFQQHSRFYSRNGGGKYPLDVFELRQAFLGSGSLRERARELRAERLGRILAEDTPVRLSSPRYVCVHVMPHAALAGALDLDILRVAAQNDLLRPIHSGGWSRRFNLDGFLTVNTVASGLNVAYLQVHRTAVLETVTSRLLGERGEYGLILPSLAFSDEVFRFITRAGMLLAGLGVEPPASVFVSLLGAQNATLAISQQLEFSRGLEPKPFDRDAVLLREVLLTTWQGDAEKLLKPLLDELWQAAGLERCFDYDAEGNWKPHRGY